MTAEPVVNDPSDFGPEVNVDTEMDEYEPNEDELEALMEAEKENTEHDPFTLNTHLIAHKKRALFADTHMEIDDAGATQETALDLSSPQMDIVDETVEDILKSRCVAAVY